MDNVCCSHRCTSYVRPWSGARPVFKHRRVPLVHLLSAFLATATLPINFLLCAPKALDIRSRPKSITSGPNQSGLRSLYFAHCYPPVDRSQADSSLLGSFGSCELPINHE